jgi:hypothetical protein
MLHLIKMFGSYLSACFFSSKLSHSVLIMECMPTAGFSTSSHLTPQCLDPQHYKTFLISLNSTYWIQLIHFIPTIQHTRLTKGSLWRKHLNSDHFHTIQSDNIILNKENHGLQSNINIVDSQKNPQKKVKSYNEKLLFCYDVSFEFSSSLCQPLCIWRHSPDAS